MFSAHEKCVQWKVGQSLSEFDVSKAPGVWGLNDAVPDWVLEALEKLIRYGEVVWQGDYERLPPGAASRIQDILEDRMTHSQGWSLNSLLEKTTNFSHEKSTHHYGERWGLFWRRILLLVSGKDSCIWYAVLY